MPLQIRDAYSPEVTQAARMPQIASVHPRVHHEGLPGVGAEGTGFAGVRLEPSVAQAMRVRHAVGRGAEGAVRAGERASPTRVRV